METRRNSAAKQSQTDEERLTTESSSQRNKSHTGSAFPKRQIVYDLTHHHRSFFEEKPEDETVREEERKRLIDAEERESIGQRETGNADQRSRKNPGSKLPLLSRRNATRRQSRIASSRRPHRRQKPDILVEQTAVY